MVKFLYQLKMGEVQYPDWFGDALWWFASLATASAAVAFIGSHIVNNELAQKIDELTWQIESCQVDNTTYECKKEIK